MLPLPATPSYADRKRDRRALRHPRTWPGTPFFVEYYEKDQKSRLYWTYSITVEPSFSQVSVWFGFLERRCPRDAQRDDGKRAIKSFLNVPVRGVLAESGRKPASYLYQCLCLVVKWCVPERGEKHIS